MNLQERIRQLQSGISALIAQRAALAEGLNHARGELPATGAVPDALTARITTGVESVRSVDEQLTVLSGQLTEAEDELRRDEAVRELQNRVTGTGAPDEPHRRQHGDGVTNGPRTYCPEAAREHGTSFYSDFFGAREADYDARDRLAKHMREERAIRPGLTDMARDVGTSAFAGLTVPQYLVDLVAPAVKNSDPFVANCRTLPLPASGMSIHISRITTGTTAASQETENTAVEETDMDDTDLVIPVRTIAGKQDASWQALQRSAGIDELITSDLIRSWRTQVDYQALNSDETLGTLLGVRNVVGISTVTYTDATPSVAEAWGPLFDLQQKCETGVPGLGGITHYVMHPRRWAFYASGLSTNNVMVQQPGTAAQIMGADNGVGYGPGVRGVLAGVPVLTDANIPTTISSTQDVILGVNLQECILWKAQGDPLFIRSDEIGASSLSSTLVAWGFVAFTAGRYPSVHGTISGTGLTTPTYGIAAS